MKNLLFFLLLLFCLRSFGQTNLSFRSVKAPNLKCNGQKVGQISIMISGRFSPFKYSINDSVFAKTSLLSQTIKGLKAGNYTVAVVDSMGNKITSSIKITQPTQLVAKAIIDTNVTCQRNNGSIEVRASGGAGFYTYLWSNGSTDKMLNGLSAGTYKVTVTDSNKCTVTSSVQLKKIGSAGKTYSIGDTAFCGIVFYVEKTDSSNLCRQRYLVCALNDQNASVYWYNGRYITTNAITDKFFDQANATKIIGVQGDSAVYAAIVCEKYFVSDSCKGWYLPSKKELKLMYTNLAAKKIGGFVREGYWSSVEQRKNKAWIVDFFDGRVFPNDKSNKYHVRAVREVIVE